MNRLAICAAVALLAPLSAFAQQPPYLLLSRAIIAHGGRERLMQARAERVTLRGNLFDGKTEVPFTSTTFLQLPRQYRNVVEMTTGARKRTIVQLLDGDRGRVTIDGQPVLGADLADVRQTLALNTAMRLVPLLDVERYTLQPAGEYNLDGTAVVGVKVVGKDGTNLKLYFGREKGLLMAAEHEVGPPTARAVQQARYSQHRDVGGHVRPGKVVVYRNGVKAMEAELVSAERMKSIPDAVFHVP
jgi:hypothetical protein